MFDFKSIEDVPQFNQQEFEAYSRSHVNNIFFKNINGLTLKLLN
jgi:hypothetical protein